MAVTSGKCFHINGFTGILDGTSLCLSPSASSDNSFSSNNPSLKKILNLTDQNLAAALYSVTSPTILPYILTLIQYHDIWATLEHRLQATTRSRIIQLKNELHHLSKGEKSITQYLLDLKSKVVAIQAADNTIDHEDVILYTLNRLPSSYQSFKMAIRTNLQPLKLDDLYILLCSE
ncbi:hypothetical protein KFK09_014054 [Dendrobium nobile]|uniref:Retrovirus-related Pol polyprotein from transposon TNT 1-94 n=1 Tax=Dendrobium nobile TaxID=94219 RepID=A0A8T3BBW3_DENNO|nr:hypothetical protein KFK09_014054 [Dendrobium nobile]